MRPDSSSRFGVGLWLALLSAFAFATSGTLAAGLLATGWSPLGIVIPRVSIGAAVTLGFALVALRGRWSVLRQHWQMVVSYGVVAIAVPQLAHFSAVQYLQVAQGLLIQYLAPVAIVFWLWLRRGERPATRTVLGSVVAMGGLALVLQVSAAGFSLDLRGVAWSLLAMLGNAAYFIFSSDDRTDLPPVVMVAGGTVCASVLLIAVALVGLLPVAISTAPVTYAGFEVAWWVPLVVLGVVDAQGAFFDEHTAIDWNVIFLLLGMMVIVSVLKQTGVFEFLAIWAAKRARGRPFAVMVMLVLITSIASAGRARR